MASKNFQFKNFLIQQDDSTFKITHDTCIFGSYIANHALLKNAETILEVGCGTGVLSIMFAQNTKAKIVAIDIHEPATILCAKNIDYNNLNHQITAIHKDVSLFDFDTKFDLIISNPPFFKESLLSNKEVNKIAKHDTTLSIQNFICATEKLLINNGILTFIYPSNLDEVVTNYICLHKLFIKQKVHIKQFQHTKPYLTIWIITKQIINNNIVPIAEDLVIYETQGVFTKLLFNQLEPYYLEQALKHK